MTKVITGIRRSGKSALMQQVQKDILERGAGEDQIICAVDPGLNTDAVCLIMNPQGTVAARKFMDFPAEKDSVWTVYGRIRRHMREHEPEKVRGMWR